jgi:hypothetical protein
MRYGIIGPTERMPTALPPDLPDARWRVRCEQALFGLLVVNAVVFAVNGTLAEALDSIAWLTLLAMFMLETADSPLLARRSSVRAVRAIRWGAGTLVLIAAGRYLADEAWLDAANAWFWIAVVVVLEIELRCPPDGIRRLHVLRTVTAALYAGLAVLVVIWAWRGEWLDAYDALIWLAAFVMIELGVLHASPRA